MSDETKQPLLHRDWMKVLLKNLIAKFWKFLKKRL